MCWPSPFCGQIKAAYSYNFCPVRAKGERRRGLKCLHVFLINCMLESSRRASYSPGVAAERGMGWGVGIISYIIHISIWVGESVCLCASIPYICMYNCHELYFPICARTLIKLIRLESCLLFNWKRISIKEFAKNISNYVWFSNFKWLKFKRKGERMRMRKWEGKINNEL